jgi:hypothetical protein
MALSETQKGLGTRSDGALGNPGRGSERVPMALSETQKGLGTRSDGALGNPGRGSEPVPMAFSETQEYIGTRSEAFSETQESVAHVRTGTWKPRRHPPAFG